MSSESADCRLHCDRHVCFVVVEAMCTPLAARLWIVAFRDGGDIGDCEVEVEGERGAGEREAIVFERGD